MKPSSEILDRNLEGLLRRSWRPVKPNPEFVARLERELEPWLRERAAVAARPRLRGARGILLPVLAAAAALLLWLGSQMRGGTPITGGLEELLAQGTVAVRVERDGAWRAAGAGEFAGALLLETGFLELATPGEYVLPLEGEAGWAMTLRGEGQLLIERDSEALHFDLSRGGARISRPEPSREIEAPRELWWFDGDFHDSENPPRRVAVSESSGAVRDPVETASERGEEVDEETPSRLGTVTGTVREAGEGDPVESFEVTLLRAVAPPQVAMPRSRIFEDTSGDFRWEGLEPGRYSLFVQAPGRATWKRTDLDLLPGSEVSLAVSLDPGGVIRGFVVDRESGAVIEGALVVSLDDMPAQVVSMTTEEFPSAGRAFTFSAADGSFELKSMSTGRHQLRAGGGDHACSWIDSPPVTVGGVSSGVLLELSSGGAVTGHAKRSDGTPWEGARVVASRYDGSAEMGTMSYRPVVTDEEGHYLADHLAPGMYVVLFFGDGGLDEVDYRPEFVPVRVSEGATARVDFPLKSGGASLSGTVRDGQGDPIPNASVYLLADIVPTSWVAATADREGRYEIEGIEAGSYRLFAGAGATMVRVGDVTLEDGGRETLDAVLDGHSLEIEVTDSSSGDPLSGVTLLLLSDEVAGRGSLLRTGPLIARTWLGTDGVYLAEDLPAGDYRILATTDAGTHAAALLENVHIAAEGGDERVFISLEVAGRARFMVVGDGGRPIEGVRVRLTDPFGESRPYLSGERTGADGIALQGLLSPGTWTATLDSPGYVEQMVVFEVVAELEREVPVVLVEK
jgi:hypothetical protein